MALHPHLYWLSCHKPIKFHCNLCLFFFFSVSMNVFFLEHRMIIFSEATLLTMIFEIFKFNQEVFYCMLSLTLFGVKSSASIMSSTIATPLVCGECVGNFESPVPSWDCKICEGGKTNWIIIWHVVLFFTYFSLHMCIHWEGEHQPMQNGSSITPWRWNSALFLFQTLGICPHCCNN